MGGCYKRTVSTRGIGSYGSQVEESYRSDTAADRWVDSVFSSGEPKRTKSYWVPRGGETTVVTPRPLNPPTTRRP
jgi:hypothetical protein